MMITSLADRLLLLEGRILEAQKGRDIAAVAGFLAESFREIGSSGRLYTRAEVLALVGESDILAYHLEQPATIMLGDTYALLTYCALVKRRAGTNEVAQRSRRSSIWLRSEGEWKIVFHQGTPIP